MTREPPFPALLLAAALACLAAVAPAAAQLQRGTIHGTVRIEGAEALPGVRLELSGLGATLVQGSDRRGRFHFLGLDPGTYRLAATLEGFAPVVHEAVIVAVGRNTAIDVTMNPAIDETISVTTESPLLDERRISAGATVTHTELEKVPSARDPWAVLQTVPGVLTNDVNIGGNKSGLQQVFTGAGSFVWTNTYALDGVVISDAAGGNTSTSYYDFEAFEEIEVTTGGSDASLLGGGVTLNLVTKRGTNRWRGSGRYLVADDAWQSGLAPDPADLGVGQERFAQGNRIVKIEDYGLEGGGPIAPERLFAWGFYGRNDIDRLTIDDVPELTELEHFGLKLNAQPSAQNSAVAFVQSGTKVVDGRGAGPTRPEPTTQFQEGRSTISKLEDTQILGSNLYLTGLVSSVDLDFSLTPNGGVDGPNAVLDKDFVWQNNFFWFDTERHQEQGKLDGSYFFTTGDLSHELRFGASYRRAETSSQFGWPGGVLRLDFYRSLGFPYDIAEVNRQEVYAFTTEYAGLFVQDTLRADRLTANLGLRYDRQGGRLDPASVPGVPGFETLPDGSPLLPAVSYGGRDQDFVWDDLAPRLGLTLALGDARRTLLRASFSRFSVPMDQWYQFVEWPIGPSSAGFSYQDSNGDGLVTPDEIVCFECGPLYTNGYDPLARSSLYEVDPDFEAPIHDELILGVEHAFIPELVLGLAATWRKQHRLEEMERLVSEDDVERRHARGDYELQSVRTVTLPDGSTRDVEIWGLREGVEDTGRTLLTNGERETDYLAFNLTLHKRLSRRWMLRGHLSWSRWTWDAPESEREDPNVRLDCGGCDDDGGPVFQAPITPGWSYRLGGLYQIAPERWWGLEVGGNLWGRQGYAIPYSITARGVFETEQELDLQAVRPLDDYRLPDLHLVDLRLSKPIRFRDLEASFAVECFNVFDQSTVLARNHLLEVSTSNWVQEVVNPRVFRLSVRLNWR